jgi:hypothetical protein
MAIYWLAFGLGTTFYPRMLQMFMTSEGVAASTSFSDHVWLHDGLDILSVALLIFVLSGVAATRTTLRAAAIVALLPPMAMVYGLMTTPYWSVLFLIPGAGCLAFAVWGFLLSRRAPEPA